MEKFKTKIVLKACKLIKLIVQFLKPFEPTRYSKFFSNEYIWPMSKICERCHQPFECKMENIMQCQCYGIVLTSQAKQLVSSTFNDCLCKNCLLVLNEEYTLTNLS